MRSDLVCQRPLLCSRDRDRSAVVLAAMPRRDDLKSILILGSGPIVIGQACEFDYSGVQACRALRSDGYRIILINSNPATIMTDPETADRTYIEPITTEVLAKIIEAERPDAILPTLGGQTALNCAMQLHDQGILAKYDVEMAKVHRQAFAFKIGIPQWPMVFVTRDAAHGFPPGF